MLCYVLLGYVFQLCVLFVLVLFVFVFVNSNSDLTMASIQTRAKPNAFTALHQLQRRLRHGETLEQALGALQSAKSLKAIFGLSQAEGAAVVNLVSHIPAAAKEILEIAVSEFGMVRGPITHAGLGAASFRLGHEPELIAQDWSQRMKNTSSSLVLAAKRIVEDFKGAPPGLRKPAGAIEVDKMARIARCWELVLEKFSAQLPQKSLQAELPKLQSLFEKKIFDQWLHTLTEECPAEIKCSQLPEFQKLLVEHESSIEKDSLFFKNLIF